MAGEAKARFVTGRLRADDTTMSAALPSLVMSSILMSYKKLHTTKLEGSRRQEQGRRQHDGSQAALLASRCVQV